MTHTSQTSCNCSRRFSTLIAVKILIANCNPPHSRRPTTQDLSRHRRPSSHTLSPNNQSASRSGFACTYQPYSLSCGAIVVSILLRRGSQPGDTPSSDIPPVILDDSIQPPPKPAANVHPLELTSPSQGTSHSVFFMSTLALSRLNRPTDTRTPSHDAFFTTSIDARRPPAKSQCILCEYSGT